MRLSLPQWLICATLAATTLVARADTFTFLISTGSTSTTPGSTFIVNGTLTGTPDPSIPGAIDLTGITGSGPGYTFTGIVPVGAVPTLTYDNLLFPANTTAAIDSKGILVNLTSPIGTSLARVFDNNGYEVDVFDPNDLGDITPFAIEAFTVTPNAATTPEPSTFVFLGTGALVLAAGLRRRYIRS